MSAPTLGGNWRSELEALKFGWDGYAGQPITAAAMDTLGAFSAVPCSDGGIQFELHRDGYDVEIVISPAGQIVSTLLRCEKVS